MAIIKYLEHPEEKGEYVITDIGNILDVRLIDLNNIDDGRIPTQGHLWVDIIITDDDEYCLWGEKRYLPLVWGKDFISCENNDKCKLCSDPRVLYIADRNWEMNRGYHPKEKEWRAIYEQLNGDLQDAYKINDEERIQRLEKQLDEWEEQAPPTKADWERFCLDIPTREQALKWLKKRGYQIEPIPLDSDKARENYKKFIESDYMKSISALDFGNY